MELEFCNFNFAARIGAARSVRLLPDAANSGTAESLFFAKQKAAHKKKPIKKLAKYGGGGYNIVWAIKKFGWRE